MGPIKLNSLINLYIGIEMMIERISGKPRMIERDRNDRLF